MKTPDEIKRDMAKCAKRAKQVIMYSCDVGEMAEYTETVSNTLIGGRSLIQQLEQDNYQKDERIRQLEREKEALMGHIRGRCFTCKHNSCEIIKEPCVSCVWGKDRHGWEWRGVEEEA